MRTLREEGFDVTTVGRFGANSPDAAVRAQVDIDAETLLEWRTTRRNLGFAEVALALSAVEDATGAPEAV